MPSDSAPLPNKRVVRLGRYEVVEHIATGGMGMVYRARDTESGQDVALKVLAPEMAEKPAMLERFRREARSAEKMKHDNIVRVYEFSEHRGTYYLAMELVSGTDLHNYIKRKGTLGPEEARQIVLQAARALRHASEHNIVHRDIKPSNFLLGRKDGRLQVKLTDFGLAREVDADEFRVTRAGTTVGTIDYMSPEQARDSGAADGRSDLYSLGCTWYQMLAGHVPFPKGGLGERLIKIINDPPPDVRDLNPLVSDETWAILSKLLEKDPGKRYQDPAALIEDLLSLDGKAEARPQDRAARPKKKKGRGRRPGSTDAAIPHTVVDEDDRRKLKRIILGMCGGAAVILAALIWFLTRPPAPETRAEGESPGPAPIDRRPPVPEKKPPVVEKEKPAEKPPDKGPRWPELYRGARGADVKKLRQEVEAPFAGRKAGEGAFVATVRRSPGGAANTFATLHEALSAAPAGKPVRLEVDDNGPLFTTGLASQGRDVAIIAGRGRRPLIVWDLPADLARRKQLKKDDEPLALIRSTKGRVELEGLEIACRWPPGLAEPGRLIDLSDGDLEARECTFSAAGRPPGGVTLAWVRAAREGARCRLTRCQVRGAALTALDLDAPASEVLIDGCLVSGGAQPLARVKAGLAAPRLRVVRSTLVCSGGLLDLRPSAAGGKAGLNVLAWDALLCRAGGGKGDLLALGEGAGAADVVFRAVNTLYAGWTNLLSGTATIGGDDIRGWRRQWTRTEGDEAQPAPWPALAANEPATEAAGSYQPDQRVGFASTVDAESPLGCDLKALPAYRARWQELIEPTAVPPDFPSDDTAPPVPVPGDGKYHGGKVDLNETDLGQWLEQKQANPGLGPKVVLHLSGKGERTTSPVRVKGASLVLYFEPPEEKEQEKEKDAKPLALRLSSARVAPLIEVAGGGLEVIGGTLRLADARAARVSYGLSVQGGDLRLFRTRLEGPQQNVPEGYQAAVRFVGAGESAEKPGQCLLNQCVVLSSRAGVVLDGPGATLGIRQSLVVAGTEGLRLEPGRDCKTGAAMQVTLEGVTFACRRSVAYLGDAPGLGGGPAEPIVVRAVNCAYLNPFPGRPRAGRAGLLLHEPGALARGLLLWVGEKEGLDGRLYYGAWPAKVPLPEVRPGYGDWERLWGAGGSKDRRPDLSLYRELDASRWVLERLTLQPMRDPPGANLRQLGIGGKP